MTMAPIMIHGVMTPRVPTSQVVMPMNPISQLTMIQMKILATSGVRWCSSRFVSGSPRAARARCRANTNCHSLSP